MEILDEIIRKNSDNELRDAMLHIHAKALLKIEELLGPTSGVTVKIEVPQEAAENFHKHRRGQFYSNAYKLINGAGKPE